jgi:hypothetical protein
MHKTTELSPKGSNWTRLLTDPDLVAHLGELLQTYREFPPGQRETALLEAMREIKDAAAEARKEQVNVPVAAELPHPEPVNATPPFAPDLFAAQIDSDRRRYRRLKCYFAVEIHIAGVEAPIWGNLANIGRGGCLVETASVVPEGKSLEIGLWVANGKLWVKGVVINGIASHGSQSFGVRVKFSETELSEKEHLREFLKFAESTVRKPEREKAYVAQLKSSARSADIADL